MRRILAAAERFYHEALGLDVIGRGELSAVFRCGGGVLLVFDPRKSAAPDRDVPSHGTTGAGHVAFAVKPEDLAAWREQLRQTGVLIERQVDWTQIEDVITEAYRLVAPRALLSKLEKT